MEKINFLLFLCGLSFSFPVTAGFVEYITKEFIVKVAKGDWALVLYELEASNTHFLKKIASEYYLFEDCRYDDKQGDRVAKAIEENSVLKNKVKHFERIREYITEALDRPIEAEAVSGDARTYLSHTFPFWPRLPFIDMSVAIAAKSLTHRKEDFTIQQCPTFTDMGVEAAWDMGYTGKGVVIAITDVGINTDIPDIQPNTKPEFSFNFVDNIEVITPERCHWNAGPDHGNRCAGIVGAVKNNICGDGIDFEAGIAGIKIFEVRENSRYETCDIVFKTSWIGQGLLHAIDKVDIYSNSWGSNVDFLSSSVFVTHAITTGTKMGRSGKGAIYVFPVSNLSDPYANNVYTIAVNSVGKKGRSSFSAVCACTLTSAYGEPDKTGRTAMYTTSNKSGSKCTLDFEGTSAATAIVSGIIGLALQANPDLTWRDIQDLVVQASDTRSLPDYNRFQTNGAGRRYDPILGFGLLNATTMVRLARTMKHLPEQLKMTKQCSMMNRKKYRDYPHRQYYVATVDVKCGAKCINKTETVLVNISYESPSEDNTELIIRSPHGTASRLMDPGQSAEKGRVRRTNVAFKSVNFWGETAEGQWVLRMKQHDHQHNFSIRSCELTIYGTGHVYPSFPSPTLNLNTAPSCRPNDEETTEAKSQYLSTGSRPTIPEKIPVNKLCTESCWIPLVVIVVTCICIACIIASLYKYNARCTVPYFTNPSFKGNKQSYKLVKTEKPLYSNH